MNKTALYLPGAGKDRHRVDISSDMKSLPSGWFFVVAWAVVCVMLAVVIMVVTVVA